MPKKQSDEAILFPEREIAGIVVKPWTFGNLFSIAEPLERLLDKVEEAGIGEKLIDAETGDLILDYFSFARLFTFASEELLHVISTTLDVEEDEIKALPIQDGISIVILMFNQNKEMIINSIKNAESPPQTKLQKKLRTKDERGPKKKAQ